MIRAFLAIDLPKELKKKLHELSFIPQPETLKIKWVEEKNFHLTLRFFGDVSESFLKKLYNRTEKVVKEIEIFKLKIGELGFFPEKANPRVVWIGISYETGSQIEKLLKLSEDLTRAFKRLKISEKKEKFHPHITLFRIKKLGNPRDFQEYFAHLQKEAEKIKNYTFYVREVTFFKSILLPKGPVYEVLQKFNFKDE